MAQSSTWPSPSFFNEKLIGNLIENALELHWAISFIFQLNFNQQSIRKLSGAPLVHFLNFLIRNNLDTRGEMLWSAIGPFPSFSSQRLIRNLIENALELLWAIFFSSQVTLNQETNRKGSGAPFGHFLHCVIKNNSEVLQKMRWSFMVPFSSCLN